MSDATVTTAGETCETCGGGGWCGLCERVDVGAEAPAAATLRRRGLLTPDELLARLDVLSHTAIQLYGEDLRDKDIQIKLAALGDNEMFQRVFYHAQRARLEFALAQVEWELTGVRR